MSEDGVTPDWVNVAKYWPPAERAYAAHGACIDAIRATGINHVVFCPGFMQAAGQKTAATPSIRINRPSPGTAVGSYEDAAWVMVQAAEVSDYDGQLITAGFPKEQKEL